MHVCECVCVCVCPSLQSAPGITSHRELSNLARAAANAGMPKGSPFFSTLTAKALGLMPTMDLTVRALCVGGAVCARACGPCFTHRRWASCPPWTSRCVRFVGGLLSVRAPVARASHTGAGRHAHHGPHGACALWGGCCLCARLWPAPHTQALGVMPTMDLTVCALCVGGAVCARACGPCLTHRRWAWCALWASLRLWAAKDGGALLASVRPKAFCRCSCPTNGAACTWV